MKEAAGEANMTVITIVLISIVLAVGTLLVRQTMNQTRKRSACSSSGGAFYNGACFPTHNCTTSGTQTTCSGDTMTCNNTSCHT